MKTNNEINCQRPSHKWKQKSNLKIYDIVSSMLWPISYDGIIKKGYIFFFGKIGICIEIK